MLQRTQTDYSRLLALQKVKKELANAEGAIRRSLKRINQQIRDIYVKHPEYFFTVPRFHGERIVVRRGHRVVIDSRGKIVFDASRDSMTFP